jgi:Holliday junction resolvase RusA-like endonuclease
MTNTARWELTIPAIPPTLNHCTKRGANNRYFDSDEYELFKIVVSDQIERWQTNKLLHPDKYPDLWPSERHLMVEITFYSPKVFKKRSEVLNRAFGDVDNRIKPLLDSIFTPLGRNDVHVKSVTATKEHAERASTHILIEWLN